jgi:hypothetical protein
MSRLYSTMSWPRSSLIQSRAILLNSRLLGVGIGPSMPLPFGVIEF